MKTNTEQYALLALSAVGLALVSAKALDTNTPGTPSSGANFTLDSKAVDRSGQLPASFAEIIKKITPSVVKIEITAKAENAADFSNAGLPDEFPSGGRDLQRFFDQQQRSGRIPLPREHGAASGVIVTPDGYILTNHHVVDRAQKVEITFTDGRKLTAKVIGNDPKADLAVIKVEATGLPAITFTDSSAAEVGDMVLALGNPFGIGQSVTMGMISATGRTAMGLDYEDFIQTDAAINPGNSGGALVDTQGRLIGINTAILSRSGGNDGVGFAIPGNMARSVMNDLITTGHVTRAYLGVMVQDLTPALTREFRAGDLKAGALIGDVPADSPAAKAGIETGDIVTSFAGQPVKDARSLKLAVATHKPGEKTELKVLREGAEKIVIATLEAQPGADQAINANHKSGAAEEGTLNGVGVAELDKAARQEAGVPAGVKGALITQVDEDSPAYETGLRAGDIIQEINHQAVTSADEAVKLTSAPASKETLLRIWSHGGSRFVSLDETSKAG